MKKILIAHQSSIPHYRVDFFNHLHNISSRDGLIINVVRDKSDERNKVFFDEEWDSSKVEFNIHPTHTLFLSRSKKYCLQTFIFNAWKYDIIVAENAVNNLSYPLLIFYKLFNKKIVFWGHGRDLNNPNDNSRMRKLIERIKLFLVKNVDGFFAYTTSVKKYLMAKGVSENSIFTLNNTIDIIGARQSFEKYKTATPNLSKQLVFTGRITKSKRIDFLLNSFKELYSQDNEYILHVIGGGNLDKYKEKAEGYPIVFHGEIIDNEELAKIYKACDLYLFPGYVGLGIVHAMCFDLIPVVIDSDFHKPEFDYLNNENSFILKKGTQEKEYANFILNQYNNKSGLIDKKSQVWNSISHLTVENMAINFYDGLKKLANES